MLPNDFSGLRSLSNQGSDDKEHFHLRGAKSLLELLSIFFLSCPEINKSIIGASQSYIATIVGLLREETSSSFARHKLLLVPLLTTLCVSEKSIWDLDRKDNVEVNEIYMWCVDSGAGNVLTAGSVRFQLQSR